MTLLINPLVLFFNILILSIFSYIDYKSHKIPNILTISYLVILFFISIYLEQFTYFTVTRFVFIYITGAYLINKKLFGGADVKIFLAFSFLYPIHSLLAMFALQKIVINGIHSTKLKHHINEPFIYNYPAIPAILFAFFLYNIAVISLQKIIYTMNIFNIVI